MNTTAMTIPGRPHTAYRSEGVEPTLERTYQSKGYATPPFHVLRDLKNLRHASGPQWILQVQRVII